MTEQDKILFIDSAEWVLSNLMKPGPPPPFKPFFTTKNQEALDILDENNISVIVSDIKMLQADDMGLLKSIKKKNAAVNIPIIVTSSIGDKELQLNGLKIGRFDYISKPFDQYDILARIETQIRLTRMHEELKQKNKILSDREAHLVKLVDEKTEELEQLNLAMVQALENACFLNDEYTGNHLKRVSRYCVKIAEAADCSPGFINRIKIYAPLHDVGKVGIPDSILKKTTNFTKEEAGIMEQHVVIGARFLEDARFDPMARNIVLFHHEKWDGTGYVQGLKGEEIPLEARILSIADVYDALSLDRVYRRALPESEIDAIVRERSGSHFDPRLIDVFFNIKDQLLEIKNEG
jgi:response regulator RpfG family c-di-GMP phosphodiesterase